MVLDIIYPANETGWYAKGTAEGSIYFEVPAVFNSDGTCDETATFAKVEQSLAILQSAKPGA
jgi:hypothetical protein